MNIALPNNIFSSLLAKALPLELQDSIVFKESALLNKQLLESKADIVLIPSMDLLQHKEFFVSPKCGISFEGSIANSYLYFAKEEKTLDNIVLAGDISSVEAILAKIAIHEMYDQDVSISISKNEVVDGTRNILLSGDMNFSAELYPHGLNFAEEIAEITGMPFVQYVFASRNPKKLREFEAHTEDIELKIQGLLNDPEWTIPFSDETKAYFVENIQHVIYEFDSSDLQGLTEMLRLTFFHGLIQDMFEVKYE